jgi:hypothetical protein
LLRARIDGVWPSTTVLGPDAKIRMTFDAAVLDWPATRFLLIDLESL